MASILPNTLVSVGLIHPGSGHTAASRSVNILIVASLAIAACWFPPALAFGYALANSSFLTLPTYCLRLSIDIISSVYMHVHILTRQGANARIKWTPVTYCIFFECLSATATSST
jgi:hypothetical protein